MNKIIKIGLISLSFVFLLSSTSFGYVSVDGYFRSNGTYVEPYVRSNPNGLKYDNYSYRGGDDLYNPSYYSSSYSSDWDTPTWATDPSYFEGQNIYDSLHSFNSYNNYDYYNFDNSYSDSNYLNNTGDLNNDYSNYYSSNYSWNNDVYSYSSDYNDDINSDNSDY